MIRKSYKNIYIGIPSVIGLSVDWALNYLVFFSLGLWRFSFSFSLGYHQPYNYDPFFDGVCEKCGQEGLVLEMHTLEGVPNYCQACAEAS